jgi:hypothetical protein
VAKPADRRTSISGSPTCGARLTRSAITYWGAPRAAAALEFQKFGWPVPYWEGFEDHARAAANLAREGGERDIADYLRVTEAQWTGAPAKPLEAYGDLAEEIVRACGRERSLQEELGP